MRNPADILVLNTIARNVMRAEGITMVQSITRPLGIPIRRGSIGPDHVARQTTNRNLPLQRDQLADHLATVDSMNISINILEQQFQLSLQQTHVLENHFISAHSAALDEVDSLVGSAELCLARHKLPKSK